MIIYRNLILFVAVFFLVQAIKGQEETHAENVPWKEITSAFSQGNAESLSLHFSSMVDLGLPEKDNSYSKSQGEIVMKDFFKNSPPRSFEILQKGKTSEAMHFSICSYITERSKYQVSIFLKHEGDSFLITKIKFEKQEP